ncbi:MAG: 2Fe-2S iron-sulfur cluster-binding protein [Bdellovibrionales bacterium]
MSGAGITFEPFAKQCEIDHEHSVLEVGLKHDIPIPHSCGGMGSCTTCRVLVESPLADLPPRSEIESDLAEMRGFTEAERLACQLEPVPGLVVRLPDSSLHGVKWSKED